MMQVTSLNHEISSTEPLHTVHSTDGYAFIISSSEASSLHKRLQLPQGASPSLESLIFHRDIKLVPRREVTRFNRKGYKTLQVLRETDLFVWMCSKDIFKETVAFEPKMNHFTALDKLDEEILEGKREKKASWSKVYKESANG